MSGNPTGERRLGDLFRVRGRYLRAANVEHVPVGWAADYIPTGRGVDVLSRVAAAMLAEQGTRAWSLTGPYGTGKSSFALFLQTLLGPNGPARVVAEQRLAEADPALMSRLGTGRQRLDTADHGFVIATATAQAEPITQTLLRALTSGVSSFWRRTPVPVRAALQAARADPSARNVAAAVTAVTSRAPVLMVVDEFGKNLEYFAVARDEADLFVLQEVAERCAAGLPAFLLTCQHLAFDDYVGSATLLQRREWSKVLGRFEDVPFVESTGEAVGLIAGAIRPATADPEFSLRRQRWSDAAAQVCRQLGLDRVAEVEQVTGCYPLHPVAALALPELCARYGQYGRTLFAFLAGGEPHSLASWLTTAVATDQFPTVGVDGVYDFFVEATGGLAAASGMGSRWFEVVTRIREARGLDAQDRRALKVVGLLNLISQGGGLRASAATVAYALGRADRPPGKTWQQRLRGLEARGFLTYRGFADEYRLWQGSDFDLVTELGATRDRLQASSPARLLADVSPLPPAVASRHSQRVGMLRYFDVVFADTHPTDLPELGPDALADGLVVYFLGDPGRVAELPRPLSRKPVVVASIPDAAAVRAAAVEVGALTEVLGDRRLDGDWPARRELQERMGEARRRLASELTDAFHPAMPGVRWQLLGATGRLTEAGRPGARSVSALLSDVCDQAYRLSPQIRNEMLGRRGLTSQAAKARRELLTAMVEHETEEHVGLQGYGPERAMYEALLRHSGIHRPGPEGGWRFDGPRPSDPLVHAWGLLREQVDSATDEPLGIDAVFDRLLGPPVGLKEGPIPVLLTAMLLHRGDDVAIYQDGTYLPVLSADLLERLVKTPDRFAIKTFDLGPDRARVLAAVIDRVGGRVGRPGLGRRNHSLLRVVAPLLGAARSWPEYTLRTGQLSQRARQVRTALLATRQPDELLFYELPVACGLPPVGPRVPAEAARRFADALADALAELNTAYPRLLDTLRGRIAEQLGLRTAHVRTDLAARARRLDGQVLDPRLGSFLFVVADPGLDDEHWLEAVALNITGQPPRSWKDEDADRFATALSGLVGVLNRVEALHFETLARDSTSGFDARRITITRPDGAEASTVVWVDETALPSLRDTVEAAVATARQAAGGDAELQLLAVLSEHVLATPRAEMSAASGTLSGTGPSVTEEMHG